MLLSAAIKETEVIILAKHQQVDSDVCWEMTMTGQQMEAQLSHLFVQQILLTRNQCTWHQPHRRQHCTGNICMWLSCKQNSAFSNISIKWIHNIQPD